MRECIEWPWWMVQSLDVGHGVCVGVVVPRLDTYILELWKVVLL